MKKHVIGWQKYEDFLSDQLSSPLFDIISEAMMENIATNDADDEGGEEFIGEENHSTHKTMIPLSPQLMEDISMLSMYDCWIGHTTFDVTNDTKNILDATAGVEILKVLSRYRFFVGIGKMFDFKNVRKTIEENIIPNQEEN